MPSPDSAPLETLSLAELRDLVGTQVAKVADLAAGNAAQQSENHMPPREWAMAKAQFAVLFGQRFTKALA